MLTRSAAAKPPVPADERAQPVAAHDLIAVEMSPVVPLSEAPIATETRVQIIGNADKPKLDGVQTQPLL